MWSDQRLIMPSLVRLQKLRGDSNKTGWSSERDELQMRIHTLQETVAKQGAAIHTFNDEIQN